MLETLFSRLAPHYCLSCGEIGRQICDNCFYDIELAPRQTCLKCHRILVHQTCLSCPELADVPQYVLASRDGVLARVVDEYKFNCTREAYKLLARLYDEGLPYLDSATFVPLPTSSRHVRMRSFDHTRDIVRELSRRRGHGYSALLRRTHNTAQHGSTRHERQTYAATAFAMSRDDVLDPDKLYVLCDDIVTTGASMTAALTMLRRAGATRLMAVALLQQPWK